MTQTNKFRFLIIALITLLALTLAAITAHAQIKRPVSLYKMVERGFYSDTAIVNRVRIFYNNSIDSLVGDTGNVDMLYYLHNYQYYEVFDSKHRLIEIVFYVVTFKRKP